MDSNDLFVRRHGLTRKRSRGGPWLLFLGIGAVVAAVGVAGLSYGRHEPLWGHRAPASRLATTPETEPFGAAELTSSESTPSAASEPTAPALVDAGAGEIAKSPPVRVQAWHPPPAKKAPEPKPEPEPEPAAPPAPTTEADPFATVH